MGWVATSIMPLALLGFSLSAVFERELQTFYSRRWEQAHSAG
jgi:hypothetical protein